MRSEMSTHYTNVNDTNVIPFNNKDVKHRKEKYNMNVLKFITLLSAINLKIRSLSFGKRPHDSIANNG